jgi:hypothetical protein
LIFLICENTQTHIESGLGGLVGRLVSWQAACRVESGEGVFQRVELNATMDREWNLIITHSPSSAAALVGFFALASSVFWASECHVVNKECAAAAPLPLCMRYYYFHTPPAHPARMMRQILIGKTRFALLRLTKGLIIFFCAPPHAPPCTLDSFYI